MGNVSKPQRTFLLVLLPTILLLRGKMNFRNLGRYSRFCEKTYSRQFSNSFEFASFNQHAITGYLAETQFICAAMDASFVPKSGQHTYGRDSFFNSAHNKPEKGLEISTLAVIDLKTNTAFTISTKQTPTQDDIREMFPSADDSESDDSRIDFYLDHFRQDYVFLPKSIRYLLTDGYYTKIKFTTGIREIGYHQIGKLRCDANLRYLYIGPQKSRGRKKLYGDKVKFNDLSQMEYVGEVDKNIHLYTAVINSPSLKQNLRIAFLINKNNPKKQKYVVLFSTDLNIDPKLIYKYYKARFQIEFIFRDAKQFTGLCDCQVRDKDKLNFHFNTCMAALNLAKIEALNEWNQAKPFVFSMNSIKSRNFNLHMVDTIISILELEPDLIKNLPNFQNLLTYGMIMA